MITAIVGNKWGDEGKGKIATRFTKDAKIVMRTTGGDNAGHTIIYNGAKIPLHLVPGGITVPDATAIIAPGTVINPTILLKEIELLKQHRVPGIDERLKLSGRAHVIFPFHIDADRLEEKVKKNPVGTTGRGIGPAYADRCKRTGVSIYDLLLSEDELCDKIEEETFLLNQNFANNGMADCVVDAKKLAHQYHLFGELLMPYIIDINPLLAKALDNDDNICIEGAQALMLDLFHGQYPMVTSSNCSTAGMLCGGALPPNVPMTIYAINKAYESKVGNGLFPTRLPSSTDFDVQPKELLPGDVIRENGHEYGTTTGRPRNCGWFDCCINNTGRTIMGPNYLCINHLDTIGKVGKILGSVKICTAYHYQGRVIDYFPDNTGLTKETPSPIYEEIKGGWDIDSSCESFDDLPSPAKEFVYIVEEHAHTPVKFLGTGPANDDLIVRDI